MVTNETEDAKNGAEERYPLLEAARKVLLAGIGAMALAQDEVEDFVTKLVERGEIAEKDGRKLVNEIMERRNQRMAKAEDLLIKRVEQALERLNVPTKGDIEALSKKIQSLSRKVDELKKTKEA